MQVGVYMCVDRVIVYVCIHVCVCVCVCVCICVCMLINASGYVYMCVDGVIDLMGNAYNHAQS